ncbi:hypothetical protein VTP01DRAFT_2927 [Rhizomucor pusillus]|uniref:uncharacterized protein n=1 Tax=Rhizomucor pusillus TaxID=4840 RepID=UPI0037442FAE
MIGGEVVYSTRKIGSRFSFMTSEDWRIWTVALSPFLLTPRKGHLQNWMHSVQAARIITMPSLTVADAQTASQELLKFCQGCKRLYGADGITPTPPFARDSA